MSLLTDIILFVLGFFIIYFAVDYLIDELQEYLERFNFSPMVFGILVLGLDFEESVASIFGAINHLPQLSIGNLIGNTIIAFVISFAFPYIIYPVIFEGVDKFYYYMLMLAACFLTLAVLFPSYLVVFSILNILIYLLVLIISFRKQREFSRSNQKSDESVKSSNNEDKREDEETTESSKIIIHTLIIIAILIVIIVGGELLVSGADGIISFTHIKESFFGLVIIAFLTNVEEFWIMIKAIKKNQVQLGLSVGVGKIIWNTSLIFGISGLIISNLVTDFELQISAILFLSGIFILCIPLMINKFNKLISYILTILFLGFLIFNFFYL